LIKEGETPKALTLSNIPKLVDIVFVPSIRELSDEFKFTANSAINKLVSKYVTERVQEEDNKNQKYTKVKESIEDLSNYISDGTGSAFGDLKQSLKNHMLDYGDIEIDFELEPPEPSELIKNSFESFVNINGNKLPLESQGMGFQRSLIFSLICNMAELGANSSNSFTLYLIEEPELFLHPNHQNHFRNRLMELSRQQNNQIIITSHSPYFLNNIDNYSQVKRVSISDNVSNLREISHDKVLDICTDNGKLMADAFNHNGHMSPTELNDKANSIASDDELRYLLWIDPDRANAFLSKKVLLVEGSTDKALFSFLFNNQNGDFYNENKKSEVMVVDIVGKYHFYKFANLLYYLGIPTWILHDGDGDKVKSGISHRILNNYIAQMKANSIIIDYMRVDEYLEDYLGLDKDEHKPDVSIYQKLVNNENGCRNCQNYEDLMVFVREIIDYEV